MDLELWHVLSRVCSTGLGSESDVYDYLVSVFKLFFAEHCMLHVVLHRKSL